MEKLKWIKLFEAFDSSTISKTLKFISKNSKEYFIKSLKMITNRFDIPLSNIKDDFFMYLPYSKALNLYREGTKLECLASSVEVFRDHGIENEYCKNGKILRKYGKSTKLYDCPVCFGKGYKYKNDINYVKFWFSNDGDFIGETVVNGEKISTNDKISENINDYDEVREISRDEFWELPNGSIVKANVGTKFDYESVIGQVYRWNRDFYLLQETKYTYNNSIKGYTNPIRLSAGTKSGGGLMGKPILLKPKYEKVDPYSWNFILNRDSFSINYDDVKKYISNANFAIVLDLEKLKRSRDSLEKIKKKREEIKKGAFIGNEELKKINIERRIKSITDNKEITNDFRDIPKMVYAILGSKYMFFNLVSIENFYPRKWYNEEIYPLSRFIEYVYYGLIGSENYITNAINIYKKNYSVFMINEDNLSKIINNIKNSQTSEGNKVKEALDEILEINEILKNWVRSQKIENLKDLEIFNQKIRAFKSSFIDDRFFSSPKFRPPQSSYLLVKSLMSYYTETPRISSEDLEKIIDYKKYVKTLLKK